MSTEAFWGVVVAALISGMVGLVFRRLGQVLDLLQSLDKRLALVEQRMASADARAATLEGRVAEVERDVDVIRLDHARNHGHDYAAAPVWADVSKQPRQLHR